jgi:ABC-type antimicrobial peptide transport system permease subunit
MRRQLIKQFFAESLLVVFIAFFISLIIVTLVLPAFNDVADKKMDGSFGQILCSGSIVCFLYFLRD